MENDEEAIAAARAQAERMYAADDASRNLGIEVDNVAPGRADARMTVTANMLNGHRVCHGGYLFTLADTAFAFACNTYGEVAVASGASIEFLAPARLGDELLAEAREVKRGRRTGLYDVRVRRGDDGLIALFRGRSAMLREGPDA